MTPPLAYPATLFINVSPVAVIENTMSILVLVAIPIDKPVVIPSVIVPVNKEPVNAGANVTLASEMAVKLLLGVVD